MAVQRSAKGFQQGTGVAGEGGGGAAQVVPVASTRVLGSYRAHPREEAPTHRTTSKTILCISSYFKGNAFLERARREGSRVLLLTVEHILQEPWARDSIDEVFAVPSFEDRRALINTVAWLSRTRKIDRLVALDDFDVEVAATLREHLRLSGLGDSAARFFRDKLAMRVKAKELGIPVPEFTGIFHHADVQRFLETVPAPWLLKPRFEASAIGIRKLHTAEQAWEAIHALGDGQSFHLLERMIPGELYHVDSLVSQGKVVFAEVSKYFRPLLEVMHEGGIYATRTLPRGAPEVAALKRVNEQLLPGFGMVLGASHTEFIIGKEDGKPYFIETSARVGGAHIAEMLEAATNINLWSEWAKLELEGEDYAYTLPTTRQDHAGVVISLARQEWPDTSGFNDPEIVYRVDKPNHIGFAVASPSAERVEQLLGGYLERIARDFHTSLPPPTDRPTS